MKIKSSGHKSTESVMDSAMIWIINPVVKAEICLALKIDEFQALKHPKYMEVLDKAEKFAKAKVEADINATENRIEFKREVREAVKKFIAEENTQAETQEKTQAEADKEFITELDAKYTSILQLGNLWMKGGYRRVYIDFEKLVEKFADEFDGLSNNKMRKERMGWDGAYYDLNSKQFVCKGMYGKPGTWDEITEHF